MKRLVFVFFASTGFMVIGLFTIMHHQAIVSLDNSHPGPYYTSDPFSNPRTYIMGWLSLMLGIIGMLTFIYRLIQLASNPVAAEKFEHQAEEADKLGG